jgi:hypothetical protein
VEKRFWLLATMINIMMWANRIIKLEYGIIDSEIIHPKQISVEMAVTID